MRIKNYKFVILSAVLFVIGSYLYTFHFCKPRQAVQSHVHQELIEQQALPICDSQNTQDSYFDAENSIEEQLTDAPSDDANSEQVALLCTHKFTHLDKQIFYTDEERKDFFAQIGVEYLNNHSIDYEPIVGQDAHLSEKYLSDPEESDYLTSLYAADIAMQNLMPMSIRWISNEIGHGIFAEEDLPAGGFIGIYGGIIKDRLLVGSKDYAWSYPGKTLEGGRITLDAAEKGNELRLINDGKDPNCIVQYIIGDDNVWYVCYVACKDIKKGDQLLISYGPAYWDTRSYKYKELTDI